MEPTNQIATNTDRNARIARLSAAVSHLDPHYSALRTGKVVDMPTSQNKRSALYWDIPFYEFCFCLTILFDSPVPTESTRVSKRDFI
jgi:hypothetical protein